MMTRRLYHVIAQRKSWTDTVLLTPEARRDVEWWIDALDAWNGKAFVTPSKADIIIDTDASDTGWGAVMYTSHGPRHVSGFWSNPLRRASINYRELMAVYLALRAFHSSLRNKTVLLRSDNVVTVCYTNGLGSGKIDNLAALGTAIANRTLDDNISLVATHLPGLHNVFADRLSRRTDPTDWTLRRSAFHRLDVRWGPHTIDRFANSANSHCHRFDSRRWDLGAETVDTLSRLWSPTDNNFVNAPFALIPTILDHIRRSHATATVIAPVWSAQPWFAQLLSMSVAAPVLLQQSDFLPGPSRRCEPHKNLGWQMAAFRLSWNGSHPDGRPTLGHWWRTHGHHVLSARSN
jgi:hypothetical protein